MCILKPALCAYNQKNTSDAEKYLKELKSTYQQQIDKNPTVAKLVTELEQKLKK